MEEDYTLIDNLCLMKTNKYKTVSLYLYYAYPYDLKRRLALLMLTGFIGRYSNKYNTKEKMTKARDNLYGISIGGHVKPEANLLSYTIKIIFLNPKFIKDVSTKNYIDHIKECLDNVYFSEELLKEFKKRYKDHLKRRLDSPRTLATNRIYQIIGEESKEFGVYNRDYSDEIDSITLDDVKNIYKEIKEKFSLDAYLVGDYDDELLQYAKTFKSNNRYYIKCNALDIKDLNEVIEDKDVSQSVLSVIYKTPFTRLSKEFYAFFLGNCLLGVVPTSLLFEEVREKLSLCYYISVNNYNNEGIVKIYTAIDGKNKDTVLKQIDIQINRLINKDYPLEKIDLARTLLIDSIAGIVDNFDVYTDYLYMCKLKQINCSIDEYIANLNKVTADDIANVFKEYKHVLTYMLNGVKHEENL